MPNEDDQSPQFFIGPNSSNTPPEDPDRLLDEARERIRVQDELNKESRKLMKRLLIALILITILGIVFYLVLPTYGLRLSPIVPMLCFLAILAGAILTMRDEHTDIEDTHIDSDF